MGFVAYLFGVVDMANALVARATLFMLGIALFFKAATKATDDTGASVSLFGSTKKVVTRTTGNIS